MTDPAVSERLSLVEQRQQYLEETVVKHMAEEDKRNEETKAIQSRIFDKIDIMQQTVTQNTIDNTTGVNSIKNTIIIVGGVLSVVFGALGVVIAFSKLIS